MLLISASQLPPTHPPLPHTYSLMKTNKSQWMDGWMAYACLGRLNGWLVNWLLDCLIDHSFIHTMTHWFIHWFFDCILSCLQTSGRAYFGCVLLRDRCFYFGIRPPSWRCIKLVLHTWIHRPIHWHLSIWNYIIMVSLALQVKCNFLRAISCNIVKERDVVKGIPVRATSSRLP